MNIEERRFLLERLLELKSELVLCAADDNDVLVDDDVFNPPPPYLLTR